MSTRIPAGAVRACIDRTRRRPVSPAIAARAILLTLLLITACTDSSPTDPEAVPNVPAPQHAWMDPGGVSDLRVGDTGDTWVTLKWTQIGDGTGDPARYRVKYAKGSIAQWLEADEGCTVVGDRIGDPASCKIPGLSPGTGYEFQLVSFRLTSSGWTRTRYSNVTSDRTTERAATAPGGGSGIWISRAEIKSLPTHGAAWRSLLDAANGSCGWANLYDVSDDTNTCILAKALVYARTGKVAYREDVIIELKRIVQSSLYSGGILSLGRNLGTYVVAADIIDLQNVNSALDLNFRRLLRTLRTVRTWGGGVDNLVECDERRPNNWGNHCGTTRVAIAAYLGDTKDLHRAAMVFNAFLGGGSSYSGFEFGSDKSWACNARRPVGINPAGCSKNGHSLSGVMPDDQRRAGSFRWPPPKTNYAWEGMQGIVAEALMLHRAGYSSWGWGDKAILRAARWLYWTNNYPASGDDQWAVHVINKAYHVDLPVPTPARPGKAFGWTDWTMG